MLYLIDIWMIVCGIAGVCVAIYEMRRTAPRMIAMATAAWLVILFGGVIIAMAVRTNNRMLQLVLVEQERVKDQLQIRQATEEANAPKETQQ